MWAPNKHSQISQYQHTMFKYISKETQFEFWFQFYYPVSLFPVASNPCTVLEKYVVLQPKFDDYIAAPLQQGKFFPYSSQQTHQTSTVRVRYGVPCVDFNSDLCSSSQTAVLYIVSCYIGPRGNSTRLHWVRPTGINYIAKHDKILRFYI